MEDLQGEENGGRELRWHGGWRKRRIGPMKKKKKKKKKKKNQKATQVL
ncbi:MAG: hypothetical protein K2X93_05335 [Candidatus Obscuribacterales bacterium]|nr:hypothetical protein [Candidatus Obscuribacterales bacterium]